MRLNGNQALRSKWLLLQGLPRSGRSLGRRPLPAACAADHAAWCLGGVGLYAIKRESRSFELQDSKGRILDTDLENSCPTVSEELGLQLIKEIEKQVMLQEARLAALRGGEGPEMASMSKTTVEWLQKLRKLFAEVPAKLLERVLPDDHLDPELFPWNRHVRRRLKKADEIILHLFNGPDERTWKELETRDRRPMCGQAYILHLRLSGKVKMILAGPPCRTVSRLRHTQPGPPPLRTRFGATRFGRDNLSDQLRSMVADDTVLFLRSLTYVVAEESAIKRPKKGPDSRNSRTHSEIKWQKTSVICSAALILKLVTPDILLLQTVKLT